jgi:hypothetical protein
MVVNTAFAGVIIVAFVRFFAPRFERFPKTLRLYSNIDVPALPAVAADTAKGTA